MNTVLDYKCPSCGGAVAYVPGEEQLKCPYCDSVFSVSEFKENDNTLNEEVDPDSIPQDNFEWESCEGKEWDDSDTYNMSVFVCQSCGGEIVGDSTVSATKCPYCGNNVILTERLSGVLKPDYVIPFEFDREFAKQQYRKHISHKFLLPKEFADENRIDEIKGIYVPFWLFDSKVDAFARFRAQNTRSWSDSKYRYTEVKTYDIFRSGEMQFEHIPVDGSEKIPNDLMESIEPFDFSRAVSFQSAYLAGFFADKYDCDDKKCMPRANERLRQSTIDILRDTVHHYDSVTLYDKGIHCKDLETMEEDGNYTDPFVSTNTGGSGVNLLEGKVHYALYPVYLLNSTYNGIKYTFAMNGQTGRFVGNLPVDKKKRARTFAAVFAATAIITAILAALIGI